MKSEQPKINIILKEKPKIKITKKETTKIIIKEKFPAIRKSRGIIITKREQIKDIVEQPLVKACEIFWDKNIRTLESSANYQDIKSGFCWITIDFDSLSKENKEIGQKYGKLLNDRVDGNILEIKIPVSKFITKDEISEKAAEIANAFQKQKATWIHGRTLNDHLDAHERFLKGKYPAEFAKEKERLSQPGVWEEECRRSGRYFDTETGICYASEEYYKKAKE